MIFLTLLIFPVLIALGFKFFGDEKHKVTVREFLCHIAVQLAVAGITTGIILYNSTADQEIWNGRVSNKQQVRVSCSHSYSCNCVQSCSGTGKNRSCTTICQTCYDHAFDYNWVLTTTNGETINVQRVDRQGLQTPPRWARANVGDPTAISHHYENFIKAAPDSLFAMHGLVEEFKPSLPAYPARVYDYHYVNRAVGNIANKRLWDSQLMELNADIGRSKQANVVLVHTPVKDSRFYEALNQYWLGGKKNDIVVVLHAENKQIKWARVMAWVDNDLVKIKIRDELAGQPFTPEVVLPIIRTNVVKYYKRKPMHDFEYLESSIKPSQTEWIVSMLVGCLLSIVLGWYFWKHDAFNEERNHNRYRHPYFR